MRSSSAVLVACAAAVVLRAAPARADAATEAKLREALRSTASQLRALEDERGKWQAKEAELRAELESVRRELASARQRPARVKECNTDELSRRLAEQTEASGKLDESLKQCQRGARDSADAARSKEEDRAHAAAQAKSLTERVAACESKNARMYKVGKDIIDWLSRVGVGAALAAREPFLGVKRVELENVAQDYEDKLLEQKVQSQP